MRRRLHTHSIRHTARDHAIDILAAAAAAAGDDADDGKYTYSIFILDQVRVAGADPSHES